MNGHVERLLIDTDVLVDHLRGARRLGEGDSSISYSVVTRCELFAGRGADEEAVGTLLAPFAELPLGREIAELAGRMRRETGVRIPDALIGATALHHGLQLVTRNRRDFDRIPGLQVRAPR